MNTINGIAISELTYDDRQVYEIESDGKLEGKFVLVPVIEWENIVNPIVSMSMKPNQPVEIVRESDLHKPKV